MTGANGRLGRLPVANRSGPPCQNRAEDPQEGDAEEGGSVAPGGGVEVGAEKRVEELGFEAGAFCGNVVSAEPLVLSLVEVGEGSAVDNGVKLGDVGGVAHEQCDASVMAARTSPGCCAERPLSTVFGPGFPDQLILAGQRRWPWWPRRDERRLSTGWLIVSDRLIGV